MVSSDEINRRLNAKRRGVKYQEPNRRVITNPPSSSDNYKECPSCHTKNPSTAKFCVGCGEKLPSEEEDKGFSPVIKGPETEEEEAPVEKPIKAGISQRPDDFGRGGIQKIKESIEASESSKEEEPPTHETPEIEELAEPEPRVTQEESLVKKPDQTAIPVTPVEEATDHDEPPKSDVDPVERIKKAKELLDIGALTQEEFDIIKKKYLDDI